jgi:hypothetical protein
MESDIEVLGVQEAEEVLKGSLPMWPTFYSNETQ